MTVYVLDVIESTLKAAIYFMTMLSINDWLNWLIYYILNVSDWLINVTEIYWIVHKCKGI